MSIADPRFLYILISLPILFGLVLVGSGIKKLTSEKSGGIVSMIFGIGFLLFAGLLVLLFTR